MKTMSKKLASIVLALCLCFSLVGTALAASGNTGSITVNGTAGEEYSIYQIFDLTYSDDGNSYSYQAVSAWASFLNDYYYTATVDEEEIIVYPFILDENNYLNPDSPIFDEEYGSSVMVDFAKAALAYATENGIDATTSGYAVAEAGAEPDPDTGLTAGSITFEDLALGWYLVDSSQGALCMLTSTDPSAEIDEKNPVPTISKYVEDKSYDDEYVEEDEGDNNDTLEYELVIDNVHDIEQLVIHDYMDPYQLDISTVAIVSVILYANAEDKEGTVLTESQYTYRTGACTKDNCGMEGCTFEIAIADSVLAGLDNDAYLVILYDVQLSENLSNFDGNVDEIDNYANISFGLSQMGTPVEAETYSYGFGIYKYNSENEALANAKFVLSKDVDGTTYYATFDAPDDENYYLFSAWVESIDDATTLVTDEAGMIYVEGLHDGTFALTETAAPEGYNMLEKAITVVITAEADDLGSFTLTQDGETVTQVGVLNNTGAELPGTGGIGTTIFYIIGGVLVAGAVVVLVTRRRMNGSEG